MPLVKGDRGRRGHSEQFIVPEWNRFLELALRKGGLKDI